MVWRFVFRNESVFCIGMPCFRFRANGTGLAVFAPHSHIPLAVERPHFPHRWPVSWRVTCRLQGRGTWLGCRAGVGDPKGVGQIRHGNAHRHDNCAPSTIRTACPHVVLCGLCPQLSTVGGACYLWARLAVELGVGTGGLGGRAIPGPHRKSQRSVGRCWWAVGGTQCGVMA